MEGQQLPFLTIGIPCYDDFDGVWFTVMALRLYHGEVMEQSEIVVVDNHPQSNEGEAVRVFIKDWVPGGRYIPFEETVGTAAAKNAVFREARGEAVLCLDSHIMFEPDAVRRLIDYFQQHPDSCDLLHGPLVYDDLQTCCTHLRDEWRGQMRGVWEFDTRGAVRREVTQEIDESGTRRQIVTAYEHPPFEIPAQGMGVFACRRNAWPGFHPYFQGFGGEEGYIHDKFRRLGRRVLCLPFLRWIHRFGRPKGVPYRLAAEDKLRNYLIGNRELNQDPSPTLAHFRSFLDEAHVHAVTREVHALTVQPLLPANPVPRGPEPIPCIPGKVSCLMATYGRWSKVCEALTCFLGQDYPHRELIILNSHPVPLRYSHPLVRVLNETGFPTLGHCRNRLLREADGEFVRTWDDDDLYLPWTLSQGIAHIGEGPAFKPARSWFAEGDRGFRLCANVFESSITMRTDLVRRTGYRNGANDEHLPLIAALEAAGGIGSREFGSWSSYVYRWGNGVCHISGFPSAPIGGEETANLWQRAQRDDGRGEPLKTVDLAKYWQQLVLYADGPSDFDRRLATDTPEPICEADLPNLVDELVARCSPREHGLVAADVHLKGKRTARQGDRELDLRKQLTAHPLVRCVYSIESADVPAGSGDSTIDAKVMLGTFVSPSSEPIDLLLIHGAEHPHEALRCLQHVENSLSERSVVVFMETKDLSNVSLVRALLEPTHAAAHIGDCFIMAPRVAPGQVSWRDYLQKSAVR